MPRLVLLVLGLELLPLVVEVSWVRQGGLGLVLEERIVQHLYRKHLQPRANGGWAPLIDRNDAGQGRGKGIQHSARRAAVSRKRLA